MKNLEEKFYINPKFSIINELLENVTLQQKAKISFQGTGIVAQQ